jgi:predicted GTPase
MGNSHKNLLRRNHWANCKKTFVELSLDDPLPKLCPVIPTSNHDGRQAKNRKKGVMKLKKIFSSETTEPISTKLYRNDPWVVPLQNYVWHFRPSTKMATTAERRRAEPPDTFLEENHPMTISSNFCSYLANGFRQDFYGNFP